MSAGAIGSILGLSGSNPPPRFDPAKMINAMAQRFIKKADKDSDGMLSSQELSGLSADAFKALDTDGDGKLSADELKAAMKKALDAMKQAMSGSDPQQAMSALKDTPEGQLMQLMRAHRRHGQGGQAQGVQIQSTSIQITINQTVYNMGSSGSMSSSGIDVQA